MGQGLTQDTSHRRFHDNMANSLSRTQNFTCTESIERTVRMGSGQPSALAPLRVDAGVIDGTEVYATPSVERDVATLKEVVGQFTSAGTGTFALPTRAVFLTNAATFYRAKEESKDGRRLARWDFTMPREASKYTLTKEGRETIIGYSGSFWADTETADVVRLEWTPDNIPPETGIKTITQSINYGRNAIAGVSVLLPSASELIVAETAGRELRIKARYDDCHKFTPNSATHLTGPVEKNVATPGENWLPADVTMELRLEDPIDERTSAVNSTITFRVTRDIKKDNRLVVPKDAAVTGRITRISRQFYKVMGGGTASYYIVGIQLESVAAGEEHFRVVANLETVGPTTILSTFVPFSQSPDKWGHFQDYRDQLSLPVRQPGESVLGLISPYLRIPKRLRMVWSTLEPPS